MATPRAWFTLSPIAVVAGLVLLAASVHAQPCADPDGDGDITDADGVITLLAAAGLDTQCSLTTCDINTDGVIDDTDGVLVFQKAAGLEVEDNCIETTGGPVDQRAVILVQRVLPFLQEPFQFVPQLGGLATPDPNEPTLVNCDNFGDGEIETTADEDETIVAFFDCLIGNTNFDGEIADGVDGFLVGLTVLDRFSDDEITYESEGLQASDTGMSLRLSGTILASPFFEVSILEDADEFDVKLFNLVITPGSTLLSGRVTLDLAETELPDLTRIVLEFDGTNIILVTVTDGNITDSVYLYDIAAQRFL